jgi:hypothetical protein
MEAGLSVVPVMVLNLTRAQHSEDQWVVILREHNAGREKSFDELVRQRLVDIAPEETVQQIVADQITRSLPRIATIDTGAKAMMRYGISSEKRSMADAILELIKSLDEYLPVSLRAVHYRLLTKTFWRNAKDKTKYRNDKNSYKDLSNLATRMRLNGEIPNNGQSIAWPRGGYLFRSVDQ